MQTSRAILLACASLAFAGCAHWTVKHDSYETTDVDRDTGRAGPVEHYEASATIGGTGPREIDPAELDRAKANAKPASPPSP
ncbi:MAG TPA: hypothetical protein VMI53_14345 [Opitutaceae bacterium]|nr:hypothetical protein [Opitutaceae bacterium]